MSGHHKLALSCPLAELHQLIAFHLVWASTTFQAFCKKKNKKSEFLYNSWEMEFSADQGHGFQV